MARASDLHKPINAAQYRARAAQTRAMARAMSQPRTLKRMEQQALEFERIAEELEKAASLPVD